METPHVVTVFLRHEGEVLLLRRSETVNSYPGRWGTVTGHAEGEPDELALVEIEEETGIDRDSATLVRRGDPFSVTDSELDVEWVIHPYLFDVETRSVTPNWETEKVDWVAPTEILHRETVPDLWGSYDRVRPTLETVAADDQHGSAYISIRALEVLRDEAGRLAIEGGDWETIVDIASTLLECHPEMAALRNRINRAMAEAAAERTLEAVHDSAIGVIDSALRADSEAARLAISEISGKRVFTISRSGTVLSALERGDPSRVLIAESRPGGEGIEVAEMLAEAGVSVVVTSDANVPGAVEAADVILLGADTVRRDGAVRNKVGTTAAMLAGQYHGIDRYVVCARDKIDPRESTERSISAGETDEEGIEPDESTEAKHTSELPDVLYAGEADVEVSNPTFEWTPTDLVTGIITEDGIIDSDGISDTAEALATLAAWDEE